MFTMYTLIPFKWFQMFNFGVITSHKCGFTLGFLQASPINAEQDLELLPSIQNFWIQKWKFLKAHLHMYPLLWISKFFFHEIIITDWKRFSSAVTLKLHDF